MCIGLLQALAQRKLCRLRLFSGFLKKLLPAVVSQGRTHKLCLQQFFLRTDLKPTSDGLPCRKHQIIIGRRFLQPQRRIAIRTLYSILLGQLVFFTGSGQNQLFLRTRQRNI